jgi:hypothetical protein
MVKRRKGRKKAVGMRTPLPRPAFPGFWGSWINVAANA